MKQDNNNANKSMIVYNLTIKVDHRIHAEWLHWFREEHIPEIMATGQFTAYKFFRLLGQDELDGPTYVTQYIASGIDHYQTYIDQHSSNLQQKATAKWGNHLISFHTVMEAVK